MCRHIKDISRTFPHHIFFSQRHGPGQRSLYNVLKAYSVYDRDVGYVQGMGFVAGKEPRSCVEFVSFILYLIQLTFLSPRRSHAHTWSFNVGALAAGTLLLYMSEEDAFWVLVALLKGAVHEPMEGLYGPGLPLVQQCLFQFEGLLADHLPRLSRHFSGECIHPSMYASQWFITVWWCRLKPVEPSVESASFPALESKIR